ncbi:MAG: plasmid pRiA4b ORF-3 family protein [Verrucomicrobia bacterium]|nr:plasmid pRiA4b ORF-3 family protein [Verrucomicrobiota bacterium]
MIPPKESAASKGNAPIYQLKIVLLGSKSPVWRRLQVPDHASLAWLHAALQVTMGWTNSHLHHFLTAEGRYTDPSHNEDTGFGEEPDGDESKATLAQVAPEEGAQFGYEYDFGDSWEHEITVEKILPGPPSAATTALCLDGARAGPPEDCGGLPGYAELLKVLKNPKHPEHESMKEWLGGTFNAESFDLAKVNRWLGKLKWPRVTETQLRKALMGRDGYRE